MKIYFIMKNYFKIRKKKKKKKKKKRKKKKTNKKKTLLFIQKLKIDIFASKMMSKLQTVKQS